MKTPGREHRGSFDSECWYLQRFYAATRHPRLPRRFRWNPVYLAQRWRGRVASNDGTLPPLPLSSLALLMTVRKLRTHLSPVEAQLSIREGSRIL